jgi:hypothetical protein
MARLGRSMERERLMPRYETTLEERGQARDLAVRKLTMIPAEQAMGIAAGVMADVAKHFGWDLRRAMLALEDMWRDS